MLLYDISLLMLIESWDVEIGKNLFLLIETIEADTLIQWINRRIQINKIENKNAE